MGTQLKVASPLLLTDEQIKTFITDGFLILQTDFSEEFHETLNTQLRTVYEEEGNPGNNLLPRIPELQKVFDHPIITGALTSVLGSDYMLHAHRHGHYNASPEAGGWHKDSYWGYQRMRNHHPWWAMIMYFPQDTPVELGPTGIMPGTQNYETRIFQDDDIEEEALASGKAGTFALIHYDIWHRATANMLGEPRFMLKFEFMRTKAPAAPSWAHEEQTWSKPPAAQALPEQHDVMWEDTWNWLAGKTGSLAGTKPKEEAEVQALVHQLEDEYEPRALNAAYELACSGKHGVYELLQALYHENVRVSRLAAYGLSIAGPEAVSGLISALENVRPETVVHAVFALGEQGPHAAKAVPQFIQCLRHPSEKVRRTVTEVLSMIGEPSEEVVRGLAQCLEDPDVQVRFMAGLSLARLGPTAAAAVPSLEKALNDENRYVRAHAAEALRYIGTEQAKDSLIQFLFNSRWCPTTTPANTFYP
ncbi:HEAT repeat domain-containing protein [Fictibacillus enclensis]|uniref:HEAT repeat domain-containing protein n=1 Tax=Fictibacillus enclensis TaxID=1017270 RepID=UPI0025A21675|nr:HEAT repeat domain-containing protein [Fictibacillus enclensis]MDM5200952.1 HEAT repeat domain-containing protein [Fictibacillus enclensis]